MTNLCSPDKTPISPLCFGAMQFGGTADEAAAHAMFDACRAAGLNFFDTAHVYTDGASETLLGKFAKADRDALTIATKVSYMGCADRKTISDSFDESRTRLGMEMVDLLYLHRWDSETPLEETFEALAKLQKSGAIRYIGVSNFAAWQVMKAQAAAAQFGTKIDVIQPMYNLVKRQAEVELFPLAVDQDIAVVPYSPLGGGLLTGKYRAGGEGRLASDPRYAARYSPEWMHNTAADLTVIALQMRMDPATLAVAWAMRHPNVTAPIISARDADQLRPSLAALDFQMDDALYQRISGLSQTPPPATDRLEEG